MTPSRPDDPADVIALVLDACSLWSVDDASGADEALAAIDDDLDDDAHESAWNETLAALAARRATDRHRHRLDAMVARLEGQLPVAEHDAASRELEAACAAYRRDPQVRERLLAFLLADSMTPLSFSRLGLPLAA